MLDMAEPRHTERIDVDQVIDAIMPFMALAFVLMGIETVFDML